MARPLLWLLLVPWTLPAAQGDTGSAARVQLQAPTAKDGALVHRTVSLVKDRLDSLGVLVNLVSANRDGVYRIGAQPSETEDPAASLKLDWAKTGSKKNEHGAVTGNADALEALAAEIAIELAERAGRKVSALERELLLARRMPFAVQARIGAGQAYLAAGDLRRAYSRLEQAAGEGLEFHPEAQALALRTKVAIANGQETRILADRELAASALERARVARARDRYAEAIDAYRAYLRYEQRVARPSDWRGTIDAGVLRVLNDEHKTLIETGGPEALLFDEAQAELRLVPRRSPLLGYYEDEVLRLEAGPTLIRVGTDRATPRFRLKLPQGTSVADDGPLPIVRGYAALTGGPKLAWVDLGLGSTSPLFEGRAIASGEEGLLVVRGEAAPVKLSFFRPGRHQPSFEVELPTAPKSASLTRGRVFIELADGLYVYDSETGRRRAGPFAVGPGLRHLGSHGRHGAFASAARRVLLLDVLAGEGLGTVSGPSSAVAAVGHEHGVSVVFESGDVMFFDRDGRLADRGQVPGRPLGAQSVGTLRPSLMVLSTEGVFFLLPPNPDTPRDVDVYVDLAEVLSKAGNREAALRVATFGARLGVGRVAELEAKRAALLGKLKGPAQSAARVAAEARARQARELSVSLPAFRWIMSP